MPGIASGGDVRGDESAFNLLRRTKNKKVQTTRLGLLDSLLEGYGGMQKGKVCEIFGPSSAGKTAMLMHVAINSVLPRELGGTAMTVTWVDCDGRLSMPRFAEMARARIAAQIASKRPNPPVDPDETLREALGTRLRVYQPPSSRDLQSLLLRIDKEQTLSGGSGLQKQMLVLDPINAFYWIDMMESEELRVFKQNCSLIAKLDMTILAAKSPLYTRQDKTIHREYLGDSWARLVKYRVALSSADDAPPRQPHTREPPTGGAEASLSKPQLCAKLLLPATSTRVRQSLFKICTAGLKY